MLLQFFRKSPFFRLLVFYAAGLTVASCLGISKGLIVPLVAIVLFSTVLIMLLLKMFRRYDLNWVFGIIVMCVLFISGLIHNGLERISQVDAERLINKKGVFLVKVLEQPEIKPKSVQLWAMVTGELADEKLIKSAFKAVLYVEQDSASRSLVPGSVLVIRARFNRVPAAGNPGEFNYRAYLANRKIYLQAYLAAGDWYLISEKPVRQLRTIAEGFREKLLMQYRKLDLNPTELSALSALTLGYKRDLDTQIKNAFAKAGVLHVMALSGFHAGVIAMLLGYAFGMFNGSSAGRATRVMIIVIMLWGFAIITGLSASVTRATVMLSFLMVGKFLGKKVNTYNILFASAFFMLAATPGFIADVSFQLSFLAVTGIVFFHPLLYRIIKIKNPILDKIWQMFIISCAAQLGTFPVTIYHFHQFPVFFWLTNLYVVPLAAVIIYLATAYLLLSCIGPLGWIFGKLLVWTVRCLLQGVSLVEAVPHALIDGIHISLMQTLLLLLTVFCFGLYLSVRKNRLLPAGMIFVSVLLLLGIKHDRELNRQKQFIINNLSGISSVNLISGNENLLLADPDSMITPSDILYSFHDYWIERGVHDQVRILDFNEPLLQDSVNFPGLFVRQHFLHDHIFISFYNTRMVLLKSNAYRKASANSKLTVDLVVVAGNIDPDIQKVLDLFDFKRLIIDSSVTYYDAEEWIRTCREYGVEYWNVAQQGAYLVSTD